MFLFRFAAAAMAALHRLQLTLLRVLPSQSYLRGPLVPMRKKRSVVGSKP